MRSQALHDDRWPDDGASPGAAASETRPPARGAGVPGRHTVTISGLGAEGYASRNGTRPSTAIRHSKLKPHERAGFRPDRVAMWAVFLGVMMVLVAAASSHAAVPAAHHAAALAAHHGSALAVHHASALVAAHLR